ncbi:hypothetical protein [Mycoplasma sp. 1654_15]|uniref:hypothetical protein n=1 Tax=Mycoplasma sp. 1654_15 TaxID=2725994 RepID=UPI0014494C17|nr:hypothetical protein [Mycoplasma sp. 1654_15]QJB71487.1 hypothetical protein HF996_03410 [Mycoplasma sp. 1654_15]
MNDLQTKNSKELNLSFDFTVKKHEYRILDIELNGTLRNLEYSNRYFEWFIEDLLYFLDMNRYQKRWDYETINIFNVQSLKLKKEDLENFIGYFKSVTNFNLVAK